MTTIRLPLLCKPAKASVLFSLQGMRSIRHCLSCAFSLTEIVVAPMFHQCEVIASRVHLQISGQVFVASWLSVFAVTTIRQSSQVSFAQLHTIAIRAVLPIPWPDDTASSNGVNLESDFRCSPITERISRCHCRGPAASSSSPSSQGKA